MNNTCKVEVCKAVILSVVLYGHVSWSCNIREEHRLRVFAYKILMRVCGRKEDEIGERWRELKSVEAGINSSSNSCGYIGCSSAQY